MIRIWSVVSVAVALIAQSTSALAQPAAVAKTNPLKVYMHYMPWFETPDTLGGDNWGYHWKLANKNPNIVDEQGRRQIASHYYPKIGPYASRDPHVIEYHLLLMKYSGVDGLLIDWYGVQGSNGDIGNLLTSSNAVVDRVDDFGLSFGVVLEDRFARNVGDVKANLAYLRDNYFNKPAYIRSGPDGDPLLMVFGPITLQHHSQWTEAFAETGVDPEFLPLWYESADAGANADGEFAWIYEDAGQDNFAAHVRNFYLNRAPGLRTAAGVAFPGFNDYYQEGGVGQVVPFDIPHDNGQTLAATLALAQQYRSRIDMLQLATWNDFGEGTIFEPTVEAGFAYLEQLQQFTGVAYGKSELELIFQLYRARKSLAGDAVAQAALDAASAKLAALDVNGAKALLDAVAPPGDFDGDGAATGRDFLQWQRQLGMTGLYPLASPAADANADGVVNEHDLAAWTAAFSQHGRQRPAVAVPEATSLAHAAAALIAPVAANLFGRSWRRLGHAAP